MGRHIFFHNMQTICSLTTPTCWDLHLFEAMKYVSMCVRMELNYTLDFSLFSQRVSGRTQEPFLEPQCVESKLFLKDMRRLSPSPSTTSSYWFLRNRSPAQVKKDPLSRKYLVIDSLFVEIAHDDRKLKKSDSSPVTSWGSQWVLSPIHRNLNLLHQPEPAELPSSHPHSWYYRRPDGWRPWSHDAATAPDVQLQQQSFRHGCCCTKAPNSQPEYLWFVPREVEGGWFTGGYVNQVHPLKLGGLHPKRLLCAPTLSKHSPLVSVSINEGAPTEFYNLHLKTCSVAQTLA